MSSTHKVTEMGYLNFYFQIHQPRRLRRFGFFDIGNSVGYFDDRMNREIIRRVARQCYQPANEMLIGLIKRFPRLRLTFSISGVALEQLKEYAPEVIESFKKLASTGAVEFLAETYYHSLAFLTDADAFVAQIMKHRQAIEDTFGIRPRVFRNTELIYSDEVGRVVRQLGFEGIYADGVEKILHGRTAGHLGEHVDGNGLKILLRNYSLSDDIAFRFSDRRWKEWPLTAEKFCRWLRASSRGSVLTTLAMDYETFGEHQKAETGIFNFMKNLMTGLAKSRVTLVTASEAIASVEARQRISAPAPVSWADKQRDMSAWLGNDLQRDAFDTMIALGRQIAGTGDSDLLSAWMYLQTSDHFYYMSTKKGDDGRVHNYFSPYSSPYEAFINYMNVLSDLALQVKGRKKRRAKKPSSAKARGVTQKAVMVV